MMHLTFVHMLSSREIIDGPSRYWSPFCIAYWGYERVFRIIATTLEDFTFLQPNLLDWFFNRLLNLLLYILSFVVLFLWVVCFKVILFHFGLKRLLWNHDPYLACQ